MSNELIKNKIIKEGKILLVLIIVSLIIAKIAFYKEDFVVLFKVIIFFFWAFVIPGFTILYYWHEKLDFLERFILSFFVNASIIGISSYYIGLMGINVRYHGVILPLLLILFGSYIIFSKLKEE